MLVRMYVSLCFPWCESSSSMDYASLHGGTRGLVEVAVPNTYNKVLIR